MIKINGLRPGDPLVGNTVWMPAPRFVDLERFWCPQRRQPSLTDEGYLIDPDSPGGAWFNRSLRRTGEVTGHRCTVLLGEPGPGKTTLTEQLEQAGHDGQGRRVLRYDLAAYTTDQALISQVFQGRGLTEWAVDPYPLSLVLDGFDECLRRVPSLARLVADQLRQLRTPLLHTVITCRTAVWPVGLAERLRDIFADVAATGQPASAGDEAVAAYELTPLRRTDVAQIAEREGLDAEAFLTGVESVGVAALAAKPITLKMLINEVKAGRPITTATASQVTLYGRGVLALCEEHETLPPPEPTALSSGRLVAVAGRVAAAVGLTGLDSVWIGRGTECPDDAVDLSDIDGGVEKSDGDEVRVDRHALRQALATGLFTSRGPDRLGFAHQTYMEYLAARALAARPANTVRPLLQDSAGAPLETMRGVSAWLMALRPEYGDLAIRDPVAFAASGVEISDPRIRSAVVEGLMTSARESRTWSLHGSDYRSLRHPGLADQLAPILANHDDELEARYLAVQLAEFTGQQLLPDVRRLAMDPAEPDQLRAAAVAVIARVGDDASRAAVGRLATEPGDDPRDDIKGAALEASFRHGVELHDVLEALTAPKVSNYSGAYRVFVGHTLPEACGPADVDVLLDWAVRHVGPAPAHLNVTTPAQ